MISSEEVFSLLSVKDGMKDDRYFVGREVLLSNLNGCVIGRQRSPAWIYGPRRIGKSSAAKAVSRKAEKEETSVIWVDAIDLQNPTIEEVLKRAIDLAPKELSLTSSNTRQAFEELAASSQYRPVITIFDEFDKVALNFKSTDQAFLRRLATDYDRFCYLFITCLPPASIVEEISEISSRILGICTMQRVMPLERRDIKALCSKVSNDLKLPNLQNFDHLIWDYAGGFPVAMTSIAKKFAVECFHKNNLDNGDFKEFLLEVFEELEIDIQSYWNTLSPETRSVILEKCDHEKYITNLKEDGFYNRKDGVIRPKFFLMISNEKVCTISNSGSRSEKSDDLDNVVCLFKLIAEINQSLHLKGYPDGIYVGNRTAEFYKIIGGQVTDVQFKESMDYLYKVFFEGAREQKGNVKKYRLPAPIDDLYKEYKTIGDISNLRNYLFHDKTRPSDSEKANRHYKEVGKIFEKYCGGKYPDNDNLRQKVRSAIIKDLLSLFEIVFDKVKQL